jgi:hypothetical protein
MERTQQRSGKKAHIKLLSDEVVLVKRSTWRSFITHSSLLNEPCTPGSLWEKVAPYKQVAHISASYIIRLKIYIGELNMSKKMLSMIYMH